MSALSKWMEDFRPPQKPKYIPHPSTLILTLIRFDFIWAKNGYPYIVCEMSEDYRILYRAEPVFCGPLMEAAQRLVHGYSIEETFVNKFGIGAEVTVAQRNETILEYFNGMCGLQYIITTEEMRTSRERTWTKYHWERFYG